MMEGSGLNRLRRIATPDGWQVERRWHPDSLALLGADMHAEVAAQRLAAAHGLAPPVLGFDPDEGVLRMPWVEGSPLEPDWASRAARRAAMGAVLGRLRAVAAPALPRLDLAERVRLLHRRLAARDPERGAARRAELAAALDGWEEARCPMGEAVAADAGEGRACLVHGDLTPGNVRVRADGSLLLLDWEYAHAGGPWDDLAALCAAADGEPFADWAAAMPPGERARFGATRRLRRLLDALWRDLRAGIRTPPEAH